MASDQNNTHAFASALKQYANSNTNADRLKTQTISGLGIPAHDYIVNTYDGSNNMLTSIFKTGGASGTTVATLTMTYDGSNNLLTVTRT